MEHTKEELLYDGNMVSALDYAYTIVFLANRILNASS
jgi:hypothetical protein